MSGFGTRLGAILSSLTTPGQTSLINDVRAVDEVRTTAGPQSDVSPALSIFPVFKLLVIFVFTLIIISLAGAFFLSMAGRTTDPAMNLMVNVCTGLVGALIGLLGGKAT
jgi:hypothetical protein